MCPQPFADTAYEVLITALELRGHTYIKHPAQGWALSRRDKRRYPPLACEALEGLTFKSHSLTKYQARNLLTWIKSQKHTGADAGELLPSCPGLPELPLISSQRRTPIPPGAILLLPRQLC